MKVLHDVYFWDCTMELIPNNIITVQKMTVNRIGSFLYEKEVEDDEVIKTLLLNLNKQYFSALFYAERIGEKGLFGFDERNLNQNIDLLEARLALIKNDNAKNSTLKKISDTIKRTESYTYLVELPSARKSNNKDERLIMPFWQIRNILNDIENNTYFNIEIIKPLSIKEIVERIENRTRELNKIEEVQSVPLPKKMEENFTLIPIGKSKEINNEERIVTRNLPLAKWIDQLNIANSYVKIKDHKTGKIVMKLKCEEFKQPALNRCKSMPSTIVVDGNGGVKNPRVEEYTLEGNFKIKKLTNKKVPKRIQEQLNSIPHPLY